MPKHTGGRRLNQFVDGRVVEGLRFIYSLDYANESAESMMER